MAVTNVTTPSHLVTCVTIMHYIILYPLLKFKIKKSKIKTKNRIKGKSENKNKRERK